MIVTIKPAVLDREAAAAFLAISVSTLEKQLREGNFPKPRLLSGSRVGWIVTELEDWLAARPVSNLPPPPNTGAAKPRRRQAQKEAA